MSYGGTKILIVEDHDDFRRAVRKHIEKHGVSTDVYEADSGEIGIGMAVRSNPDIVLMDISLPGIDGIDAARQIKSRLPKSKIIFLTMFEAESFRETFQSDVASDYIGKSDLYEKLVPAIKRILDIK